MPSTIRITKFTHSCLLVEYDNEVVLFDPGAFSKEHIDRLRMEKLDAIIITHEHSDHMHAPTVVSLRTRFPDAPIITTKACQDILQAKSVNKITSQSSGPFVIFESRHESLGSLGETPQNIGVHYKNIFTHPGDSHNFNESKSVLALPVTAPWGSMVSAVEAALRVKPQYIVPIHDWHWSQEAKQQAYERLLSLFKSNNIIFLPLMDNTPVEVKVDK